jgi:hypothetical protein
MMSEQAAQHDQEQGLARAQIAPRKLQERRMMLMMLMITMITMRRRTTALIPGRRGA